jgi:CHAT domain-containing protein
VAQSKLNADLVVLSACNTASAEKPGAKALSGLARAFFYAGACSLIVSHWEVNSNSAVTLMTGAFAALARCLSPEAGLFLFNSYSMSEGISNCAR